MINCSQLCSGCLKCISHPWCQVNCSFKKLQHKVTLIQYPKFPKWFSILLKFFVTSFFYSGYKKFWFVQKYFPIVTNLNKINVYKKAKSVSTFDFNTLYTTIPRKLLLNALSEVINFSSNLKSENALAFLKHLSIGLLMELEKDALLNKLLPMLCLSP